MPRYEVMRDEDGYYVVDLHEPALTRKGDKPMNIQDISYFLATQGYTLIHFWDTMEFQNLDTMEEAMKFIYQQKFCS
jgi:hypothetical protein